MEFINVTPHDINIVDEKGVYHTIKASSQVARLVSEQERIGEINNIPIFRRNLGKVEFLPAEKLGVGYIVSSMILSALPGRADLFAPDTGQSAIRTDGQIIAVKQLIKN